MPTRPHRQTISYAVSALCALTLLSACGSAGDGAAEGSPSGSTSASASPPIGCVNPSDPQQPCTPTPSATGPGSTSPSMPPSGRARPTTMTGRVTSTDNGCAVFKSDRDATQWVLIGETSTLRAGTAYVVEGVAMDAMDPACPQGLPFQVTKVSEGTFVENLTPPPPAKGSGVTTLTGVAAKGVEAGCRVLQTDKGVFVLVGQVPVPDGRVEVRGVARVDMATTCQEGTAFEVLSVRPLG